MFEPIPARGFTLEGHQCQAVGVGHTDTNDTTVLHGASIGLMVAGDIAYRGVHQYLPERRGGDIQAWLAALDIETEAVTAEVTEWFFEDYLPTWVGVGEAADDPGCHGTPIRQRPYSPGSRRRPLAARRTSRCRGPHPRQLSHQPDPTGFSGHHLTSTTERTRQ